MTPTLAQIATEMADYVERSNVTVTVDTRFPWVDIEDNDDVETAFHLSGNQAEEFIAEAKKLWKEAGDIGLQVAYRATAKSYVDAWA